MIQPGDWYEGNVEEGVRDVVKMLRDNGVNTCSSCHHDMTIQCVVFVDGQLQDVHNLLYSHLLSRGEEVSYELVVSHHVEKGAILYTSLEVRLHRPKVQDGVGHEGP